MSDDRVPAVSAEGRRLIEEFMNAWRENADWRPPADWTPVINRVVEADAALSAYIAGLEAEAERLREASRLSGPDRIDPRSDGSQEDCETPYLDEVVIHGATLHIEQMTDEAYWMGVYRGDDMWHFWLKSREGGKVDLTCTEQPDVDSLATHRDIATKGGTNG